MSGRRTSGCSRPSLGVQVLAQFSLHFLGKGAVQEMSGKTPGSPRRPSSRHPRPSDSISRFAEINPPRAKHVTLFEHAQP